MRHIGCWVSLIVFLAWAGPAWTADDKKDSSTTPTTKDYKTEFKDYSVVNRVQGKLVKTDKSEITVEVPLPRNMHKDYKLPTMDNMAVLWVNPPVELDEKGKPKKIKPQDRKKPVTGPGGVKGYPAETSDLRNGQIVQVLLMQKKAKRGSNEKTDNKPAVGAVYILAEPRS